MNPTERCSPRHRKPKNSGLAAILVACVGFACAVTAGALPPPPPGSTRSPAPEPAKTPSAVPAVHQATVLPPQEEKGLTLDATQKEYTAKPGEDSVGFTFAVKNISAKEIVINQVRTSCGCSIAKLPSQPWKLAPGEGGNIQLTVDLRGKTGELTKTATIDTATSFKEMTFKVIIPATPLDATQAANRTRNLELAAADRQAVFKGDCAKCHVAPTVGQMGAGLYVSACSICHDAAHRATMVPDLHALNRPTDRDFWRTTIVHGKPGTLMPAFAASQGGPLTEKQVDSLVDYLVNEFAASRPLKPAPAGSAGK